MTKLYSWQHRDYKALSNMVDKPSPAMLLSGMDGLGQDVLLKHYIGLLFCEHPEVSSSDNLKYACNACQSCILYNSSNHPDLYEVAPDIEADKKNISVEDIRQMLEFLSTSTHIGKYKIVLIRQMNLLNLSSANALLKILEEPPAYGLFILQTDNIASILPTIKSRCHIYQIARSSKEEAQIYAKNLDIPKVDFWLNYYDNTPLFEIKITDTQFDLLIKALLEPSIENIFAASVEFDGKDAAFLVDFLTKWLNDLTSYKLGSALNYFKDYQEQIDNLIKRIDLEQLFYLFDKVNFLEEWKNHPLNYKLQLENLLLQYQSLFIRKQ